ncbi:Hypothetical_protein [Hexamita inflata]|uniref:Hypothetical_protein n=1 Tax=Hexamita inflata TaxID=28002 RepID=A0ABP1HYG6_9EUKA
MIYGQKTMVFVTCLQGSSFMQNSLINELTYTLISEIAPPLQARLCSKLIESEQQILMINKQMIPENIRFQRSQATLNRGVTINRLGTQTSEKIVYSSSEISSILQHIFIQFEM